MLSGLRQGPRSRTTTRRPCSVSTLAAVAPEAPAPMMQTSTGSGFLFADTGRLLSGYDCIWCEVGQSGVATGMGFRQRRRPWEGNRAPTGVVTVPAVDG